MIAFARGHPGLGLPRIAAELALTMWGGLLISASGVLKVLNRHGLGTRQLRLALVAGYRVPTQPEDRPPEPPLQLEVERPGDLVQLDFFYIGRLSGTQGRCWQYTAIDVASSFVWAGVRVSPLNPDVRLLAALEWAHRAADGGAS